LGIAWSALIKHRDAGGPAAVTAALLVVAGLCGVIVTSIQWYLSRK
jgi:hypothetical protein